MSDDPIIGPPETRDEVVGVAEAFTHEVRTDEGITFAAWTLRPIAQGGRAAKLFFHATGGDLLTVGADALQESLKAIAATGCSCSNCVTRLDAISDAIDVLSDVVTFGGPAPRAVRH